LSQGVVRRNEKGKDRVYTVRESQGKRVFFALVRESQGKSGKLAVVRGKIIFSFCR